MNDLLLLLAQGSPTVILGVVIGVDKAKPACKVKFGDGNRDECAKFVKECFCNWSGKARHEVVMTQDDGNATVEIKG